MVKAAREELQSLGFSNYFFRRWLSKGIRTVSMVDVDKSTEGAVLVNSD